MNAIKTPQTGLVDEIIGSFCASLEKARGFDAPFSHFRVENLFPQGVIEALDSLRPPAGEPASGRRECVEDRLYLNAERIAQDDLLCAVALALQSLRVVKTLQALCGAALEGTCLRVEYAMDADGFWLEPHTDLGVKKFTGLIAVSGSEDYGTDLYASPAEPAFRLAFEPNAGTLFVPGAATWHGFARRPLRGLRKSLILNYVGPDWQSREQLAFPDHPIVIRPSLAETD